MKLLFTATIIPLSLAASAAMAQDCPLNDLNPVAMDKNKNAQISRDEAQGTALAWFFDNVDTNNDGIVGQPEFGARCSTYQQSGQPAQASQEADREPSAVEKAAMEKAERQQERASGRVESRVDQEADQAVDKAIDRGLDSLFGR